jgi:hypothetical protein
MLIWRDIEHILRENLRQEIDSQTGEDDIFIMIKKMREERGVINE